METLKNPKTIGGIAAVIVAILVAAFANFKPVIVAVCEQACPQVELKD